MGSLKRVDGMSVYDPDCVSRSILEHAVSKWGSLALAALTDGPLRFNELRRAIGGVSDRMLSRTLQQLEKDGLISREVRSTIPPRVDYALSTIGEPIALGISNLIDTIYDQLPAIVTHQSQSLDTDAGTDPADQPHRPEV